MDNWAFPIIDSSGSNASGLVANRGCSLNSPTFDLLATWSLALDLFTVVELSWLYGC